MENFSMPRLRTKTAFNLVYCILLSVLVSSCSMGNKTAKLQLNFSSKMQSLTNFPIKFVAINVSAPDLSLVSYEWDCYYQDCTQLSAEVSAGSGRLIQVLVVYETDNDSQILYGDVSQTLNGGDNRVRVELSQLASFRNEGTVAGRYRPSTNHPLANKALTGEVYMWARVASGKPDMRLSKFEIFGGWIRLFVLDNLGFRYTFTGHDFQGNAFQNVPLFNDLHGSNGLKMDSPGIQAFGARRVTYTYAGGDVFYPWGDGDVEQRPFESLYLGFFGGENLVNLCSSSIVNSAHPFNGSAGGSRICKNSSCTDYLLWGDITKAGDVNGESDNVCVPGINNTRAVHLEELGSVEGMMGFIGPFLRTPNKPAYTLDPTNNTLTWQTSGASYLPQGIEVFAHPDAQSIQWDSISSMGGDGINCQKLPEFGFVSLGRHPRNGSLDVSQYLGPASSPGFALCVPKPDGGYYQTAATLGFHSQYHESPPHSIEIAKPLSIAIDNTYTLGVCQPLMITVRDINGNITPPQGMISLSHSTTSGSLYEDHDCVTQITSSIDMEGSRRLVYYRGTEPDNHSISIQDLSGELIGSTYQMNFYDSTPNVLAAIRVFPDYWRGNSINDFEMANTETCIPFTIAAMTQDGGSQWRNFNGEMRVSFDPTNGAEIYSDYQGCLNADLPFLLSAATPYDFTAAFKTLYLRISTPGVYTISSVLSTCRRQTGQIITCNSLDLNVVEPGPVDHFHVRRLSPGPLSEWGCYEYEIQAYDNHQPHSYPARVTGDTPIVLELGPANTVTTEIYRRFVGGCYPTEDITADTEYIFTIPDGSTRTLFEIRPMNSGYLELEFYKDNQFLQSLSELINMI
jgi:hypothetical protein